MNDVLLSPLRLSELELLIERSVTRALNKATQATAPDADPYGDFHWLCKTCPGVPASTLRIKSAAGEIPGLIKFGKRVLYDKAAVLNWLRSQTLTHQPTETARRTDGPVSHRLGKKERVAA